MRVTKVVREYIEKEVKARLSPAFAAEKAEADRQSKAREELLEGAAAAAKAAWTAYVEEHYPPIADFVEDCRHTKYGINIPTFYNNSSFQLRDRQLVTSVHQWYNHLSAACKEKSEEIIITLELGGTKKDLDEMLRNL